MLYYVHVLIVTRSVLDSGLVVRNILLTIPTLSSALRHNSPTIHDQKGLEDPEKNQRRQKARPRRNELFGEG